MRNVILPIIAFTAFMNSATAQEDKAYRPQVTKGTGFLTAKVQTSQRHKVDDSYYQTGSFGIGGGYYIRNRLAMKATVMAQHYNAIETLAPTRQEYHNSNLILFSGQVRYNILEKLQFGSFFLQSGYSAGRFTEKEKKAVRRWEIISVGQTLYLSREKMNHVALEMGAGIEKEITHKRFVIPVFVGVSYYLTKKEK